MRWVRHVSGMEDMRNTYNMFIVKPEGSRKYERPRRRWGGNIKMSWGNIGRLA